MSRANEIIVEKIAEFNYFEFLELTQIKLDKKIRIEERKLKAANYFDVNYFITR